MLHKKNLVFFSPKNKNSSVKKRGIELNNLLALIAVVAADVLRKIMKSSLDKYLKFNEA